MSKNSECHPDPCGIFPFFRPLSQPRERGQFPNNSCVAATCCCLLLLLQVLVWHLEREGIFPIYNPSGVAGDEEELVRARLPRSRRASLEIKDIILWSGRSWLISLFLWGIEGSGDYATYSCHKSPDKSRIHKGVIVTYDTPRKLFISSLSI